MIRRWRCEAGATALGWLSESSGDIAWIWSILCADF